MATQDIETAVSARNRPGIRLDERSAGPPIPGVAGPSAAARTSDFPLGLSASAGAVGRLNAALLQLRAATGGPNHHPDPVGTALAGVKDGGGRLPFADRIQESFGRHDVSGIQASMDGAANQASEALGARAYAVGERVAFAGAPDLHTAAHEAAHVIQQRGGVQLKGGMGQVGDRYEQHADAVADAVVAGRSAEALLDRMAGPPASGSAEGRGVQRRSTRRKRAAPAKPPVYAADLKALLVRLKKIRDAAHGRMGNTSQADPDGAQHGGFDGLNQREQPIAGFFAKHPAAVKDESAIRQIATAAGGFEILALKHKVVRRLAAKRSKGGKLSAGERTLGEALVTAGNSLVRKRGGYDKGEAKRHANTHLKSRIIRPHGKSLLVYFHGFGIGKSDGSATISAEMKRIASEELSTGLSGGTKLVYAALGFEDGVRTRRTFHPGRTAVGLSGAKAGLTSIPALAGVTSAGSPGGEIAALPAFRDRATLMLDEAGRARLRGVVVQLQLQGPGTFGNGGGYEPRSRKDILAVQGGIRQALAAIAKRAKKGDEGEVNRELTFLFERLVQIPEGSLGDRYFNIHNYNEYEGYTAGKGYTAYKGVRATTGMSPTQYVMEFGASAWQEIRSAVGVAKDPATIARKAAGALWSIRHEIGTVASAAEARSGVGGGSPVFDWINVQRKSGTSIFNFLKKTTKLM